MARFAVGHTVDIAARHYADIPSLRPLHEQTVADALEEVLAGPMILPPQDEDRLRGELASPDPDDGGISTALLDGEQDVWLASCGNFFSSPFASVGTPCPTPFWACLDCRNAVITARKLPAILAFLSFVDAQRICLSAAEWTAKFGHAHDRIVQQILPAFAEGVVARARAQVANDPPTVYLPPEARV